MVEMLTISQNEKFCAAAIPAAAQDEPDLLKAHALCGDVRRALDGILADVTKGARDLQDGLTWSEHLERFELSSMEQARILAKFPIGTTDARFGALVHRARASFIAFRETVRREIIGAIDGATDDSVCETALKMVVGRSTLALESLKSVEQALMDYSLQVPRPFPGTATRTDGRAEN